MRSLILLLSLSIALISCKKDSKTCDDTQPLQTRIEGTWELTQIYNPWTNTSHAPSATETQTLIFADSLTVINHDNTVVVDYQLNNDMLVSNGASGQVTIDCNTLVIDNTPVDGPRNTYSRVLEE